MIKIGLGGLVFFVFFRFWLEDLVSFELAFELAGKVPFDKMLSATYPLARYVDAIAHAAESGTRGGVKVAFDMRDEKRRSTGDT